MFVVANDGGTQLASGIYLARVAGRTPLSNVRWTANTVASGIEPRILSGEPGDRPRLFSGMSAIRFGAFDPSDAWATCPLAA